MDDPTEVAKTSQLPPASDPAADTLGAGGTKALEVERKARREAERMLRESQDRVRTLEGLETRRDVASAKGLTPSQASRLVGSSREELEADADELLAAFAPPEPVRFGGPREKLQPGAVPGAEPAFDAGEVADRILNR